MAAPTVAESSSRVFSIRELTTCNSALKAISVARVRPDAVVLGADTLVALGGQTVGKPADMEETIAVLQRLRGREHQVCTYVYICSRALRRAKSFYVISRNSRLPREDRSTRQGRRLCAQGHGSEIICRIPGSQTNVMGLPMEETLAALAEFEIA